MLRKSTQEKLLAIDEVVTSMSQIAVIDTAVSSVKARIDWGQVSEFGDSVEATHELLEDVHTVDISADLLHGFADILLSDTQKFAAEKVAIDAIVDLAEARRLAVVRRQAGFAKWLRKTKLNVTPLRTNTVKRGYEKADYMDKDVIREGFEPIRAHETFMLNTADYPIWPNPMQGRKPYTNFNGYSLSGRYSGKSKANYRLHEVSLVDPSGVPIAEITPRQ